MDSRRGQRSDRQQGMPPNEPEIASPTEQIDGDCDGFAQETFDLIAAAHPDLLSSLSPADRDSLFAIGRETKEEMIREFHRIVEARRAYLRGFKSGVDRLMGGLSQELAAYCETAIPPPPEEQLTLIDCCEEAELRDPPAVHWGRHLLGEPAAAREEERQQNNEPNFSANTTVIFWDPLRIVEFDCDCRPLSWCFDVTGDGQRHEVSDMSTGFHGLPLLWRTHGERLIGEEVMPGADPRLPASACQRKC